MSAFCEHLWKKNKCCVYLSLKKNTKTLNAQFFLQDNFRNKKNEKQKAKYMFIYTIIFLYETLEVLLKCIAVQQKVKSFWYLKQPLNNTWTHAILHCTENF